MAHLITLSKQYGTYSDINLNLYPDISLLFFKWHICDIDFHNIIVSCKTMDVIPHFDII
jgi:hypothetical protein